MQYCCTYIRVHRRSSSSTYPRKRYATRRALRRYIHNVYPVSIAARYRGCVPISPVDTTWQGGRMQVRKQLPLRLYHAQVTGSEIRQGRHKLGAQGDCTGLTFVCLSRAKRLVDLMVEPMSFDRIDNLGTVSYTHLTLPTKA